jgi:hypothetical protein
MPNSSQHVATLALHGDFAVAALHDYHHILRIGRVRRPAERLDSLDALGADWDEQHLILFQMDKII